MSAQQQTFTAARIKYAFLSNAYGVTAIGVIMAGAFLGPKAFSGACAGWLLGAGIYAHRHIMKDHTAAFSLPSCLKDTLVGTAMGLAVGLTADGLTGSIYDRRAVPQAAPAHAIVEVDPAPPRPLGFRVLDEKKPQLDPA